MIRCRGGLKTRVGAQALEEHGRLESILDGCMLVSDGMYSHPSYRAAICPITLGDNQGGCHQAPSFTITAPVSELRPSLFTRQTMQTQARTQWVKKRKKTPARYKPWVFWYRSQRVTSVEPGQDLRCVQRTSGPIPLLRSQIGLVVAHGCMTPNRKLSLALLRCDPRGPR